MFYNGQRQLVSAWDGHSPSTCPWCEEPLLPRRGDWVRWHWAHYPGTHDATRCAYVESAWHLRWKHAHLLRAWEIEVPYTVGTQRFVLDARHPRTGAIREFVHSLSPHYVAKHAALRAAGQPLLWIFDGGMFMSARARTVAKGGQRHFLKPLAYDIAQSLPALVHEYAGDRAVLWHEWKKNIWYPTASAHLARLLALYAEACPEDEASALRFSGAT